MKNGIETNHNRALNLKERRFEEGNYRVKKTLLIELKKMDV